MCAVMSSFLWRWWIYLAPLFLFWQLPVAGDAAGRVQKAGSNFSLETTARSGQARRTDTDIKQFFRPPSPSILLILQPPLCSPFTPLNHDVLWNITQFVKRPSFPPHTHTHTTLIYKTTLTLHREFRSFCLKY